MKMRALHYLLFLAVMLTAYVSTTHPSFSRHKSKEDSHTAMIFHALSAIDAALTTGHVDKFHGVFEELQKNPRFKGSIVYDTGMNSIFTLPDDYEVPASVNLALDEVVSHVAADAPRGSHRMIGISEMVENHVAYKYTAVQDFEHGVIGYLVLSFQY